MSQPTQYILGKRVARGGMAEIFLAKATGSDNFERICAIKKILPHYAQEKEYVEMFRTEASICKRLQHANIVQVYDFKKIDDSYAIVMEFVDGTDLRTLLAACEKTKSRLTVPMAIFVATQIAKGLHYAHTKVDDLTHKKLEIVHRDISPQNVLISFEGEVKLIDFGIAKSEAKQQETKPGVVKGKYSYMSPEQVSAKPLDARTDVFSLAIVLWEMLAMKRLFAAESEVETIKNVQGCVIKRSLTELNPSVDQELNDIILRGLAKERKNRYESAAAFERDLLRYGNTHYPEFNPIEVGNFLRNMFIQKRQETQKHVQDLLGKPSEIQLPNDTARPIESISAVKSANSDAAQANVAQDKIEIAVDLGNQAIPAAAAAGFEGRTSGFSYRNTGMQQNQPTGSIQSVSIDIFGKPQLSQQSQLSVPNNTMGSRPAQASSVARGPQNQQKTPLKQAPATAEFRPSNLKYYTIGIIAALIVLAMVITTRRGPADKPQMQVWVATNPAAVQIALDGKVVDDGAYIETPRRFAMPSGKHVMTVSRDGYLPRRIDLDGIGGDILKAENINLVTDPAYTPMPLSISVKGRSKVFVVINDGLYKGYAPLKLSDLEANKTHVLIGYPNYPQKKGMFRCNVALPNRVSGNGVNVILKPVKDTYKCSAN